jgi:hypothetical protein
VSLPELGVFPVCLGWRVWSGVLPQAVVQLPGSCLLPLLSLRLHAGTGALWRCAGCIRRSVTLRRLEQADDRWLAVRAGG